MKIAFAATILGPLALALIASPYAVADDAGWYGGISAGESRAKIDDAKITADLLGGGFTTTSIIDDDRDTGYRLYGGYQFNKNLALEGGYFGLGRFGFAADTLPAGTLSGDIKLRGLNLDLVGTLPISEKFSLLGRVGMNYADARDSFSGTGLARVGNPSPSKRNSNYKYGLGLQYAFTESLAMRAEAERYRVNDAVSNKGDVDLVSLGLIYRFGRKAPAPAARAPAPVYVAATPEPAPAVKSPPPPPSPAPTTRFEKYTISAAELLFA
ncbi:MAG: outer membrane beta-barrel protein, partial [Sterolibacterium sp.]